MTLAEGQCRDRILRSALRQAIDGYDAVRIRAVADAAGVSVSAVYHHFSSKDGLLLDCLHGWLTDTADTIAVGMAEARDPGQRLLHVVESLTEQLSLTPHLADTVARSYLHATGAAASKAELVRDKLIQIFADAMEQDRLGCPDLNQQVAALVADVWIANILAIAQNRLTAHDLRRRLEHAISAISRNARRQVQASRIATVPSAPGA